MQAWVRGEVHELFSWGNLRERNNMEDPDDGRIILKWIFNKWDWGMDWIYLFTLLLYIAVNTTIIEYNTNATCFDLQ